MRLRVGRPVLLDGGDGELHPAWLENLSLGGLCLRGAPPAWAAGDEVTFRLGPAPRPGLFAATARVAWRRGDRVGLSFTDTPEDPGERLGRALRELLGGPG